MAKNCSYDFSGKSCLVTGASGALGEGIVRAFLGAGAKVALLDLKTEGAERITSELDPDGAQSMCVQIDVTKEADVIEAVKAVRKQFGAIDVLVNAAGILKHRPIDELTLEDFTRIIDVNLTGVFLTCREVVKVMKQDGKGGKIVNIASLGGATGRPGVGVNYAASKSAVIGLTKTLAREQGVNGIYANAVNPGPILTELTKQVPEEVFAKWNAGRAVEKNGLPEDVAETVLFLASNQSDWITGVALDINGGIYM